MYAEKRPKEVWCNFATFAPIVTFALLAFFLLLRPLLLTWHSSDLRNRVWEGLFGQETPFVGVSVRLSALIQRQPHPSYAESAYKGRKRGTLTCEKGHFPCESTLYFVRKRFYALESARIGVWGAKLNFDARMCFFWSWSGSGGHFCCRPTNTPQKVHMCGHTSACECLPVHG